MKYNLYGLLPILSNVRHGEWKYQQLGCLFNSVFRLTTKKMSKLRITWQWVICKFSYKGRVKRAPCHGVLKQLINIPATNELSIGPRVIEAKSTSLKLFNCLNVCDATALNHWRTHGGRLAFYNPWPTTRSPGPPDDSPPRLMMQSLRGILYCGFEQKVEQTRSGPWN